MLESYRVIVRDGGKCFDIVFEPTGAVLLTTQNVSVETLVRIATEHEEGKR